MSASCLPSRPPWFSALTLSWPCQTRLQDYGASRACETEAIPGSSVLFRGYLLLILVSIVILGICDEAVSSASVQVQSKLCMGQDCTLSQWN